MEDTKRKETDAEYVARLQKEDRENRASRPAGFYSNSVITRRNGGVRHQFQDDIGGCSANYK